MLADGLADALQALPPDWQPHWFDSIDSTQDAARAAARLGAPHRSLFVADYQTAGRGRQGRVWLAPAGVALMMSVVFREAAMAPVPWRWTSLASVALVEAVEQLAPGVQSAIKWPNDVLVDDRKLAGILAESSWDGRELVAIVGVGVNVNTTAVGLRWVGAAATSLRVASGQPVDRGRLLRLFVDRIDCWLDRPWPELVSVWQARLWGKGQRVRLQDFGREEEVVVLGAEADGSLRVRLADGAERRTMTGELIL